ncbi:MAG: Nif3-like dinuclear metal center hexameric protein [Ferruginibacter sp.]|nr:Nif3-like dinuclear metal center hexameric protein [Ferruginibacter sp.]
MTIATIIGSLEKIAPSFLQEEYDNAGLITGDKHWECTGMLISLDTIESVVNEAIEKKCNLIIAHHPIVFKGLKKINGKNYVEKTVISAIKNDIAIYAIHTNLDNVINGVNGKIADKIGLINRSILIPKQNLLQKLAVFVPVNFKDKILTAVFAAGAGNIGQYSECSFGTEGTGTYKAGEHARPFAGKVGERHQEAEVKVEVIFPLWLQQQVVKAMIETHPYEEVAYDVYDLSNKHDQTGSGLVGYLEKPVSETEFLKLMKKEFKLSVIRHTSFTGREVTKVALCGGAGSFLISAAKSAGADVYVTSDVKYHEFFDAEGQLLLADIGHYESEQFTTDLLFDILREKFPNFAVLKTGVSTNPVKYF